MDVSKIQDHTAVRSHNMRAILEYLYSSGDTSRTDLARALCLSKPSVSDYLQPLLRCGLVLETGHGKSTRSGGRKPIILSLNAEHRYILSISLNRKDALFVLGNLHGNQINELRVQFPSRCDAAYCTQVFLSTISLLLSSNGVGADRLCCFAISAPGIYVPQSGGGYSYHHSLCLDFPEFVSSLRRDYGLPVLVSNDVKAAAIGELQFGQGRQSRDFLFVNCGYGLGSGIILNRQLLEGADYAAGEIHNFINMESLEANTSLESMISIPTLLETITREIRSGQESMLSAIVQNGEALSFDDVTTAYRAGDPLTCRLIQRNATMVGCAVSNIVNLLSIDMVVIDGEYTAFIDLFVQTISEIVAGHCHVVPRICKTALADLHPEICGLFHLARSAYFDSLCQPEGAQERGR